MPKPSKDEKKSDFVSRYMADAKSIKDMPDEKQRLAAAHDTWEEGKGKEARSMKANMSSLVKIMQLDGRDYYVGPVILCKECVMNGLLYPEDVLNDHPQRWNGQPLIVQHPFDKNNKPISVNSPMVIAKHKVGYVFNSMWDSSLKALKAEAWIDKLKVEESFPKLYAKLEANQNVDVSTGLFSDTIVKSGIFNNKKYVGIATNIIPDHLAILPDEKGACSWEDGAGLFRVNQQQPQDEEQSMSLLNQAKAMAVILVSSFGLRVNEISNSEVSSKLRDALRIRFGVKDGEYCYVEDVFPDRVIYSLEFKNQPLRYEQLPYTQDGDSIILSPDMPVSVSRKLEWVSQTAPKVVTETNAMGAMTVKVNADLNQSNNEPQPTSNPGENMRKEKISVLITNGSIQNEDAKALETMSDKAFSLFVNSLTTPTPTEAETVGKELYANKRAEFIEAIKANASNKFSDEQLQKMEFGTLQGIASIAHTAAPKIDPQPKVNSLMVGAGGAAPASSAAPAIEGLGLPGFTQTK